MIDITLLHQHNLFFHHLTGYSVTYSRVGFMPVHSFQFYRLAVDIVITAGQAELILIGRSVFDFHFPETDNRRYCLDTPVFMIFQFRDKEFLPTIYSDFLLSKPLFPLLGYSLW